MINAILALIFVYLAYGLTWVLLLRWRREGVAMGIIAMVLNVFTAIFYLRFDGGSVEYGVPFSWVILHKHVYIRHIWEFMESYEINWTMLGMNLIFWTWMTIISRKLYDLAKEIRL